MTRELKPFSGKETAFSTNGVGTIGSYHVEERELIQDSSYWQGISLELSQNSQLVDVRFKTQSLPSLSVEDQATSKQAAEEIFTNSALKEIAAGWVKKSTLTQELADDPEFLTEIKEMSQVKLSSKLRGVSYEIEEN